MIRRDQLTDVFLNCREHDTTARTVAGYPKETAIRHPIGMDFCSMGPI